LSDVYIVPDQGLLRHDLVIQLDNDIEEIKLRKRFWNEVFEKEDFQKRVKEGFRVFENYVYWNVVKANRDSDFINIVAWLRYYIIEIKYLIHF
jgi:hypothetical protein